MTPPAKCSHGNVYYCGVCMETTGSGRVPAENMPPGARPETWLRSLLQAAKLPEGLEREKQFQDAMAGLAQALRFERTAFEVTRGALQGLVDAETTFEAAPDRYHRDAAVEGLERALEAARRVLAGGAA